MLNNNFSKEKFQSFDFIFGFCVLLLTTYLMISSNFLSGSSAQPLSPEVLSEIRNKYYSGEDSVPTLLVFETSWCGVCRGLERELKARKLHFKTVDVESSKEAYDLYMKVYGQPNGPVPVTVARDKVIVGNGMSQILEALETKG